MQVRVGRYALFAAIVVLLVGGTRELRAAPKIGVLVRGIGSGSGKAAGLVAHYASEEMRSDSRYEVVDLGEVLGNPNYERAMGAFAAARKKVEEGRKAYEEFELDRAADALTAALSKFRRHAAYLTDFNELADILMMLGALYSLQGEEEIATDKMREAYLVYPDIKPDPRLYNPSMRELFEKSIKALRELPGGSISLSSNPSYVRVYVDGRFVGVTPTVVESLVPGNHYIKLVKDGFRSWGRVVKVRGGAEVSETATMRPTEHFDDFDNLLNESIYAVAEGAEGSLPEPVEDMGTLLNADHLFIADVRISGERVEVRATQVDLNAVGEEERWVASSQQVFSYDGQPATYAREMKAMFRTQFSAEALAGRGGGAGESAGGDAYRPDGAGLVSVGGSSCLGMNCDTFKGVMLWGVGGLGVVSMGVGGVMWALAQADHGTYRGTGSDPQPTQVEAQDLRTSGESKAIVGDILMGVGVVAVATSAVSYLLWDPGVGADDVMRSTSGGWGFSWIPLDGGAVMTCGTEF